jgi:excisionase family DNA binding protein
MNKEDVAKALGCSTRQIEKFASEGRLGERVYVRGKRGRQADYKPEEVERLKIELERERAEVIGHASPFAGVQALQRAGGEQGMSMLASVLADALRATQTHANGTGGAVSITDLAHKLTLSLMEASQLSGLSRGHLREAIENKKLKARIIGRGWRMTRASLDAYVAKNL